MVSALLDIGQIVNQTGAKIDMMSDSSTYPNAKGHPDFTTEIIFRTMNKIYDSSFEAAYTKAGYPITKIEE